MELSGCVGRAGDDSLVGQRDLDGPAGHWRTILVSGHDIGLDRLAPVIDGFLEVEGHVDRLELVRLNLERACEVALAGLIDAKAVGADRGTTIQRQSFMEGA